MNPEANETIDNVICINLKAGYKTSVNCICEINHYTKTSLHCQKAEPSVTYLGFEIVNFTV